MKHSLRIVILLITFFFVSQIIGLFIVSQYLGLQEITKIDETTNQTYTVVEAVPLDLPNNIERPEFENPLYFIGYIILAIIIATLLFLFLIRLKTMLFWKVWFFFAVFLCLSIAFYPFIGALSATLIAFILALWKILRPSMFVQNMTEIFMYGGLAAIFVPIPIVNEYVMIIVLLLISGYDAYAVWKSKHMIRIAKFQANSKVFAGLLVPYKQKEKYDPKVIKIKSNTEVSKNLKNSPGKVKFEGVKTAILGGGDVAFPLLFTSAVLKSRMIIEGFSSAFLHSMIISVFVTIALALLFFKGRQDRFYPAMPFLTAGCLIGYAVMLTIGLII